MHTHAISNENKSPAREAQRHVAVILPAYNEEQTVRGVILDFHKALPQANIYIIDNASTDGTNNIAKNTMAEHGIMGAVLTERRKGKGNAVRRAFLDVDADVYLMADADSTYPAEQAWELIAPVLAGEADMVIGDRRSGGDYLRENRRPLHNFGNALVQRLVNMVGHTDFVDIMSGYRAMSRAFVRTYPLLVEGFQLETDLNLFAAQGRFRCLEIPVRYVDRPQGSQSKLSTMRDGFRVLWTIFRIARFYNPLFFFSICAILSALAGLLLGVPVVLEYMRYQFIYKIPSAILASALEILAMLLFSVGLTLDGLAYQRRMEIEWTIQEQTRARFQ